MTVIERIRILCKERKNISLTTLEEILNYSNGSLSKAKDIPSSRIFGISQFLGVSMEFLMTGKDSRFSDDNAELDAELLLNDKARSLAIDFLALDDERKMKLLDFMRLLKNDMNK